MLTGKTSIYIDTVKTQEDAAAEAPPNETKDPNRVLLEEWEEEKRQKAGERKRLDRSQFGKYIISFGQYKK